MCVNSFSVHKFFLFVHEREGYVMEITGIGMSTTVLSNANTNSAVGIALLDKAIETDQMNGDALTKMLERSVNPMLGQNIDIRL